MSTDHGERNSEPAGVTPHSGPQAPRPAMALALGIVEHRRAVLVVVGLVVAVLAAGVARLEIQSRPADFIESGSLEELDHQALIERFGSDERAQVLVEVDDPFAPETVERLRNLAEGLTALPLVERVDSFVDLLDAGGQAAVDASIVAVPSLDGVLFGDGAQPYVVAVVTPTPGSGDDGQLSGAQEIEYVESLMDVTDAARVDDFEPTVSGLVAFAVRGSAVAQFWITLVTAALFGVVALLTALSFRHRWLWALPLIIVGMTLLATLGLMGWTNSPLNAFTQIMVMLVIVAGVADTLHVLHRSTTIDPATAEHPTGAIATAATGPAIVFTSVTTAAGFGSFAFVGLDAFASVGIYGAFGVIVAMVLTLALCPILLHGARVVASPSLIGGSARQLVDISGWAQRRARPVIAVSIIVIAVGAAGATQLTTSFDPADWLGTNDAIDDAERIDETTGFGGTFEIILDDDAGDVTPERIGRLVDLVEAQTVGGTAPRALPNLSDLPAVAIDDTIVASSGTVRTTFVTPFIGSATLSRDLRPLEEMVADQDGSETVVVTGTSLAVGKSALRALSTAMRSYAFALAIISIVLAFSVPTLRHIGAAILPNVVPAFVVMAIMGFGGIPIDPVTLVVGGIVVGISVDDTVHMLHAHDRSRAAGPAARIDDAVRSVGPAITLTSAIVVAGLALFAITPLPAIRTLGLLGAAAVFAAWVADVVLLPALLSLIGPRRE